jgi:hypothetical protein
MFALALLAHVALVSMMLRTRTSHERHSDGTPLETTILLAPAPPRGEHAIAPPPVAPATKLRSIPHPAAARDAIEAPVLEPVPIEEAASAPASAASATPPPLNLTLTRDQLRAVIAGSRPTLAQSLARGPAPSPLSRVGGDDSYSETPLPGGVTEVHVHGECYRLVPTPRSQSDPFNHGNERLTGPCLGSF